MLVESAVAPICGVRHRQQQSLPVRFSRSRETPHPGTIHGIDFENIFKNILAIRTMFPILTIPIDLFICRIGRPNQLRSKLVLKIRESPLDRLRTMNAVASNGSPEPSQGVANETRKRLLPARPLVMTVLILSLAMGGSETPAQESLNKKVESQSEGWNSLPPGAKARLGTVRLKFKSMKPRFFAWNGELLGITNLDDSFSVWELPAYTERLKLKTPTTFSSLAIAPNGKRLIAGNTAESTFLNYDLATGKVTTVKTKRAVSTSIAFSPDGNKVALGKPGEPDVYVCNANSMEELFVLSSHGKKMASIVFSPDGKNLAFADADERSGVMIWDMDSRKEITKWLRPEFPRGKKHGPIDSLLFSADGKSLAVVDRETVEAYEVLTGRLSWAKTKMGAPAASCPNRQQLAATESGSGTLLLMNFLTGEIEGRVPTHDKNLEIVRLLYSKKGDGLIVTGLASDAFELHFWEVAVAQESEQEAGHLGPIFDMVYSRNGKMLASGDRYGSIFLWDANTGRRLRSWPWPSGNSAFPRCDFCANDKILVVGGVAQDKINFYPTTNEKPPFPMKLPDGVNVFAISKDKSLMAVANWSGDPVELFQIATGKKIKEIPVPRKRTNLLSVEVASLQFSAKGDSLIIVVVERFGARDDRGRAQSDDTPFVVDLNTSEITEGYDGIIRQYYRSDPPSRYSRDGRLTIVSSSTGRGVMFEERYSATSFNGFWAHPVALSCAEWAPDGKSFCTGGYDTSILIWPSLLEQWKNSPPLTLTGPDMERAWHDLAETEATVGYSALRKFVLAQTQAVHYLEKRLQPSPTITPEQMQRMIRKLESANFRTRESVGRDLTKSERAGVFLKKALKEKPSPELRLRIERLLPELPRYPVSGEKLRNLRAIQALEWIGTAGARKLLSRIATGDPRTFETQEAIASLGRLGEP
jgi:WD40 repeat protein